MCIVWGDIEREEYTWRADACFHHWHVDGCTWGYRSFCTGTNELSEFPESNKIFPRMAN